MAGRTKHRVSLRIVEANQSADAGWFSMEFLHANPDRRGALMAYLREQFPDRNAVSENMDGVFIVVDPLFPDGSVRREYRVS